MLITLCILETLKRCSSEDVTSETHPMTQKEIRKKIEEDYPLLSETVTAKKVRTRLEELIAAELELKEEENRAIGYHEEVGEKRTIRTGYYLKNAISDMELKYLVDSVMYGKIFNTEQAEDLAHRIQNMSGKKLKNMTPYVNSTFGKQRYQLDIDVLHNVEVIVQAMQKGACISFQWNVYDVEDGKAVRKKKNAPTVKPLNIILYDSRYSALVRFQNSAKVYHYNVDLMEEVVIVEGFVDEVKESEILKNFEQETYILRSPWNFGGDVKRYRLRVKREYFSRLVESFSYEARILPGTITGDTVDVQVHASEKGMLYWLLHHYEVGELIECKDEVLRDDLRKATEELYKRYH